jgi:hypothetical protein
MSKSNDFFLNDVASIQRIDSLNFPAAVGELGSVLVHFNVNVFVGLFFQSFYVIVIYKLSFESLAGLVLLAFFFISELSSSNRVFNRLNAVISPLNLPFQKIWNIRQ